MYLLAEFYEMTGKNECIKRYIIKVKNVDKAKKRVEKFKKKNPDYFYCFRLYDKDNNFIDDLE